MGDRQLVADRRDDHARDQHDVQVYLLGHALFRLRMAGTVSWRRLGGAAACVLAGLLGSGLDGLALAALVLAIVVAVIASEQLAAHRRRVRGEPSPLERLDLETG